MPIVAKIALAITLIGMTGPLEANSKIEPLDVWVAQVAGMSCPLCSNNIEKQLKRDKLVSDVEVDLGRGTVTVYYLAVKIGAEDPIRKSVERAGFTVLNVERRGGGS